jgi:plastocyanin
LPVPVVLALIAILAMLLAPVGVAAHDLEPTDASPDVVVEIGSSVSPREVRVRAGTVVGWVNRDDDEHRVRSRSGPAEFDSGNLEPGERFAVRLTAPGTYAYVDDRDRDDASYHGRIVVTSASEGDGGSDGGAGSAGGGAGSAGGGAGSVGGGATTDGGAAPTAVTASIGDRVFQPSTIRVAAGGTVTWTNDDDDEHTVTATDASFDSGVMGGGATHRQRFPTAGTFAFLCAIHPEMRGDVVVSGAGGAPAAPAATPTPLPTPSPTATPAPPATPTGPGAPTSVTIEMRDFAFGPAEVTVADGATVTFANVGAAPHTATADDGSFDTALVAAGTDGSVTVDGPGTIAFACTFHPEMRGRIDVVPASAAGGPGASPDPVATASPSPEASATAAPSATTTAAAAAGGGAGTTSAGEGGAATTTGAASSTAALEGLVGLMVAVTLVSVAAALFARTINGTVRRPS